MTKIIHKSDVNILTKQPDNEDIFLFMQYFIPDNNERLKELKESMVYNCQNKSLKNIYLLNETYYKKKELGIHKLKKEEYMKIIQKDINKRLSFKILFDFIKKNNIDGYIVISNTDIFFDFTLDKLHYTNLKNQKAIYSLVRYEYTEKNLRKCKLFGDGRADSQDVWIIHSSQIPENTKIFDFNFGVPGCDNKLMYLFLILGYKIYNDPFLIRTYHNHKSEKRNYNGYVLPPHCYVIPQMPTNNHISRLCKHTHLLKNFKNIDEETNYFENMVYNDNQKLIDYLNKKIKNNENFVIPRIAGVENNVVHVMYNLNQKVENRFYDIYMNNNKTIKQSELKVLENALHFSGIKNFLKVMKNNAGILIGGAEALTKYTFNYLKAFDNSDIYLGWEKWGNVYKYIVDSHNFIDQKYKKKQKSSALS